MTLNLCKLLLLFLAKLAVFFGEIQMLQDESLQKAYTQYSLVSIELRDVGHVQFLNSLDGQHGIQLDFWKRAETDFNQSLVHAEVLVAPEDKPRLTALLHEHRLHHHIKVDDVEELIRAEREETGKRRIFTSSDDPSNMTLDEYHNYEEIRQYLLAVSKKYSHFVTYWNIGKSSEGRDLAALRIGYTNSSSQPKKAAFIDGCIHAREWIACATLVYIINQLTASQDKYTHILEKMDIYILPVLNPDGYEFTWRKERLWRKTRSGPRKGRKFMLMDRLDSNKKVQQEQTEVEADCYGADANRNFDFDFKGIGSSEMPCSDTFSGPFAFSEPEAKAVADFLEANKENVQVFLDVHSYSEKFIYPYGNEDIKLGNKQEMKYLGEQVVGAMNRVNGEQFKAGSVLEVMYPASGLAIDYAMGHLKIPYSFAMELRPQQTSLTNGFVLPSSEIVPGARECWTGIQVVLDRVMGKNHIFLDSSSGKSYMFSQMILFSHTFFVIFVNVLLLF